MTSRLKHKLELENVNLKSAYLNESFVLIGTPLPALGEHKKDKQEYAPLWEQEVRDEKGRRRFHGAFTGGFSAGYFNSVGSKEGWTPATFKSSRTNRASKVQRPEDFMDEEDLAQMNEDRLLENTDTFKTDTFAGTSEELAGKSIASPLESLLIPSRSSIGHTLLQKLGWRPGQGIGPRVTIRKLHIQEGKLGRIRAGMETDKDDDEASKHTFAPRDARLLVYDPKDDKEGLGYEKGRGMGKLPSKRTMYGAGPGEDDEDDLYGEGSSNNRHVAFDVMEHEDDVVVMGGPPRSPKRDSMNRSKRPEDVDMWHDGRPVLVGFILDPKGVPPDKWFEFPDIPADWRPRPARVWGTTKKWDELPGQTPDERSFVRGAPGKPLTHDQRGAALGEITHISAAKSVFEYISEKDRERLAAFAAAAKEIARPQPLSLDVEPELPPERATEVLIPPLSPRTASAALQGFMPYTDDADKQERYRSYLVSQTYNTKYPNPQLLPSTSVDEVNKELNSFAASARIFKPMSFAMSSRFTSGSASLASSDLKQAKPGLHLFDATKSALQFTKPESTEVEVTKLLTPREQAAANGQYGQLTRVIRDFYPVKLVCKRFHVADPHPEGAPEGSDPSISAGETNLEALPLPKNDAAWQSQFIHQSGTDRESSPPSVVEGERVPRTLAEVGMADDVNQGRDTLTYTKPNIDIFKSIFASDDEDEEDEDDGKEVEVSDRSIVKTVSTASAVPIDPYPVDDRPVDYNTFKPVFRRLGDEFKQDERDKDKDSRRRKDKKKRKGVLSFDVGEDDEDVRGRDEKKKRKESKRLTGQDEGEWVEKSKTSVLPAPAGRTQSESMAKTEPPPLGRKGASDLW